MLRDVIGAVLKADGLSGVATVTNDPEIEALSREFGFEPLREIGDHGLNAALEQAVEQLGPRAAAGYVVIPSDVPLIRPVDVETVIHHAKYNNTGVIVPSREGRGTNCLAINSASNFDFHFGSDSFAAHQAQARSAQVALEVLALPNLAHDIDIPQDLEQLFDLAPGQYTRFWLNEYSGENLP